MEEEKVWLASYYHLIGVTTQQWYYQLERDEGILAWARFEEFVNMRFGPPIRSNILGELVSLRRTGSVEEYQRRFLALLCRVQPSLPQSQQVNLFTVGLLKPLRTDVEIQNPTSLQMAMSLARAYEQRLLEAPMDIMPPKNNTPARVQTSARTSGNLTPSGAIPPATSMGSSMVVPTAVAAAAPGSRFRRLTTEEMADRRQKGLCFNCPEKFSKSHKCSMKGVFLLELNGEASDDDLEDHVEVSLHALTGISDLDVRCSSR
ncbi:hypothetical protein ACQ4PT_026120 [Festuca glaucescens]